jgi:hypothetical protein
VEKNDNPNELHKVPIKDESDKLDGGNQHKSK